MLGGEKYHVNTSSQSYML